MKDNEKTAQDGLLTKTQVESDFESASITMDAHNAQYSGTCQLTDPVTGNTLTATIKDGKPHGTLAFETSRYSYYEGKLDGPFVQYWPNGKECETGQYVDGEKDGTFFYYDNTGKVDTVVFWAKGVKIEDQELI